MHPRIRTYAVAAAIALTAPLLTAPGASAGRDDIPETVIVTGRDLTLHNRISPGHRPVRLERLVGSHWRVLDRTRAAGNGSYTLRGGRHLSACTWAKLRIAAPRYHGHPSFTQPFVMPVVRQRATLIPTAWARPGGKATFRGILVPQSTRPVDLQVRRGERWITVATARPRYRGEVFFNGIRVPGGAASYRITARPYDGLPRVTSRPAPVRAHAAKAAPSTSLERLTSASATGGDSTDPQLSADGRYLLHTVHDSAPGTGTEVRLLDRTTGTSTSILDTSRSVGSTTLTADGRYVALVTTAQVLPSDTDHGPDVYLYDRVTGTTTLESPTYQPSQADTPADRILGKNARYLVYQARKGDRWVEVVRDRVRRTTHPLRSALPLARVPAGQRSILVDRAPGDPCDLNTGKDATLLDVTTGHETDLAPAGERSDNSDGEEFQVSERALSANGRYAAYLFIDYGRYSVMVSDAVTGVTRELPVPASAYTQLSISADGSRIAVVSNEEAAARHEASTVVVTDWRFGQTWEVAPPQDLSIDDPKISHLRPSLSADGSQLAFTTDRSLDPTDTNGTSDVYLAHLG